MNILDFIKGVWNKMLTIANLKQVTGAEAAINQVMKSHTDLCAQVYMNQPPWLDKSKGEKSLNLGAALAREWARATTIEMKVDISGGPRAEYLTAQLKPTLDKMRDYVEFAGGKGGVVFKPYPKGKTIAIDVVQADMMFPTAFDSSGVMTGAVFVDQKVIGGNFYTRLESHLLVGNEYRVTNKAFKSSTQQTIGNPIPLSSVPEWADLQENAKIAPIDRPLFAYFKKPGANNIDPTAPHWGLSVFSGAIDFLEQADHIGNQFFWEMESAQRALYVDASAFTKDASGNPVLPTMKRIYRTLQQMNKPQLGEPGFFQEWSPDIREQNYLNAMNEVYRRIEYNCGFSYGVLSNPQTIDKTATEVKNSQQRYYSTITDAQKSLQVTLDHIVWIANTYADIYNLAPAGTYTANYSFDDSIVADHDTQFSQDKEVVGMGAMSKLEFRMRTYGEDEATAKQKLALVQDEAQAALQTRLNAVRSNPTQNNPVANGNAV